MTDGRVTLRIANSGEVIPAEEVPHLFERFYRRGTSRNRREGGSGLGMAIVAAVAEAHGGSVGAEGSLGGGLVVERHATGRLAADRPAALTLTQTAVNEVVDWCVHIIPRCSPALAALAVAYLPVFGLAHGATWACCGVDSSIQPQPGVRSTLQDGVTLSLPAESGATRTEERADKLLTRRVTMVQHEPGLKRTSGPQNLGLCSTIAHRRVPHGTPESSLLIRESWVRVPGGPPESASTQRLPLLIPDLRRRLPTRCRRLYCNIVQ